jgi:hypothetical protein
MPLKYGCPSCGSPDEVWNIRHTFEETNRQGFLFAAKYSFFAGYFRWHDNVEMNEN